MRQGTATATGASAGPAAVAGTDEILGVSPHGPRRLVWEWGPSPSVRVSTQHAALSELLCTFQRSKRPVSTGRSDGEVHRTPASSHHAPVDDDPNRKLLDAQGVATQRNWR